jgi:hypothetical protein
MWGSGHFDIEQTWEHTPSGSPSTIRCNWASWHYAIVANLYSILERGRPVSHGSSQMMADFTHNWTRQEWSWSYSMGAQYPPAGASTGVSFQRNPVSDETTSWEKRLVEPGTYTYSYST